MQQFEIQNYDVSEKYDFEVFETEFREFSKFALEYLSKSTFQCHSFLSNCLSFQNFEKFRKTNQKVPIFRKKMTKLRFFSLFNFSTGGAL